MSYLDKLESLNDGVEQLEAKLTAVEKKVEKYLREIQMVWATFKVRKDTDDKLRNRIEAIESAIKGHLDAQKEYFLWNMGPKTYIEKIQRIKEKLEAKPK